MQVKKRLCFVTNVVSATGWWNTNGCSCTKQDFDSSKLCTLCGYKQDSNAQTNVFEGVPIECYASLKTGFRLGIPYSIPSAASLETFLKAVKSSDIIDAHGHPYLASLIMEKLAKRYSKPFVLTQHNTFIEYNSMFDDMERLNDLVTGKEALKKQRTK